MRILGLMSCLCVPVEVKCRNIKTNQSQPSLSCTSINSAFEELRRHVPTFPYEKRLSKVRREFLIKWIVWEIYQCVSEVLSQITKKWNNVFDQNVPGSLTRVHLVKHVFSTFGRFLTQLNPKNHTKHPP